MQSNLGSLDRVIARIRERLKQAEKLREEEREFLRLKNLQWTEAERSDARKYQRGMVVQFHQNVPGFRRGERVTVRLRDERSVQVEHESGKIASLPMDKAARFQVYETPTIALATGEMIRITQNGFTRDGQRLNNGDLKQVKGFTKNGDIQLANGWVISKDYGNLTHGYCVRSYGSQSKGVDCVFVAESSESFRAADRQQFYVSASRFKKALTIYTDDRRQLLEAVSKSSQRISATDLVTKPFSRALENPLNRKKDETQLPWKDAEKKKVSSARKQRTGYMPTMKQATMECESKVFAFRIREMNVRFARCPRRSAVRSNSREPHHITPGGLDPASSDSIHCRPRWISTRYPTAPRRSVRRKNSAARIGRGSSSAMSGVHSGSS